MFKKLINFEIILAKWLHSNLCQQGSFNNVVFDPLDTIKFLADTRYDRNECHQNYDCTNEDVD